MFGDILRYGQSDEKFFLHGVICFILIGRDTTLAALTWFFWLLLTFDIQAVDILL